MGKRLDNPHFKGKDTGCKVATEYLNGIQSSCDQCPFDQCIYDAPRRPGSAQKIKRNELIIKRDKEGVTAVRIAKEAGVSEKTVWNVIHREKEA